MVRRRREDDQEPEFAGARIILRVFLGGMIVASVACGLIGYFLAGGA
jgi:hypothetical protein